MLARGEVVACSTVRRAGGAVARGGGGSNPPMTGDRSGATARARLPVDVRLLVGAGFVVAVGYGVVAPALPEYARSFNVGITAAAAVVSGFALVRLAFAPASGRLVDRLGEPLVFSCGLLVVGA